MNGRCKLLILSVAVLVGAVVGCYYLWGRTQSFKELLVFGDSLSDVGNYYIVSENSSPKEPYYEGRFSNGPLWIEVFAEEMGFPAVKPSLAGGMNYAYGGARTGNGEREGKPDIGAQIDEYLKKTGGKVREINWL